MPDFVEEFYWFGECGFSTKLFQNNVDSFAILAVLAIKLLLLAILIKIIKKFSGYSFENSIKYSTIFLMELISVSPYMVISSYTSL